VVEVYREHGYVFRFYSNEGNEPPHVHVRKGGSESKWWLDPIAMQHNYGYSPKELRVIRRIIEEELSFFLDAWNEIHGNN
jgi:hypothetical protein